jgi:hypothetical protein
MIMNENHKENLRINKAGDNVYFIADELFKLMLTSLPGGNIADSVLNFHGNLKKKRAMDFSESLKSTLESFVGREFHANDFGTEDFLDVFEAAYQKVLRTSSEFKREKYKDIVINRLVKPDLSNELVLRYINLIDELSEIQILIMTMSTLGQLSAPRFIELIKKDSDTIEDC